MVCLRCPLTCWFGVEGLDSNDDVAAAAAAADDDDDDDDDDGNDDGGSWVYNDDFAAFEEEEEEEEEDDDDDDDDDEDDDKAPLLMISFKSCCWHSESFVPCSCCASTIKQKKNIINQKNNSNINVCKENQFVLNIFLFHLYAYTNYFLI